MPLETGTWTINVNGQVGQLNINNVSPSGALNGTLEIPGFFSGFSAPGPI
jgi:hypothetical protein